MDFSNEMQLQKISAHFSAFSQQTLHATPLLAGTVSANAARPVLNPADHADVVGHVVEADAADVQPP